jgi:lipopolysaccharide biosynthesis glycosyltransferase
VATATDRNYLPYAVTMLLSLYEATQDGAVQTYVLHDGSLSDEDQAALVRSLPPAAAASVHFPELDRKWLSQFPSKGPAAGDRISWARLALPAMLPDVSRLLYLDADTFVCESVAPLFSLDLEGNIVGAVRNVIQPAMHGHVASLGIHDPHTYFNAGVLLIDMDQMRERDVVAQICSYVATDGPRLYWYDQDALNVLLADRWTALHPRWNTQNSYWTWSHWAQDVFGSVDLMAAKQSPAILHFEGPDPYKPWHVLSQHPFTDEYRGMLAQTPWAQEAITGRTPSGRLLTLLPTSWQIPAYHRWENVRNTAHTRAGQITRRLRRR